LSTEEHLRDREETVKINVNTRLLVFMSIVACSLATMCAQAQTFVYTNDNVNGANTVSVFSVGSTGALTQIGNYGTGGVGAPATTRLYASNRLAITGNYLYATNDDSNTVTGFKITPATGALGEFGTTATGGTAGYGESLAATPDGRFLIAGNNGTDTISVFSIAAATGTLSQVSGSPFAAGGAPEQMRVTPDGAFLTVALYLSASNSRSVGVYSISSSGVLAPVQGSPFAGSGNDGSVDVNCAGNRLFAADYSSTTTLVDGFNIAVNGSLSAIPGSPFGNEAGVGTGGDVVLLSPNNNFVFVTDLGSLQITVFGVANNGSLAPVTGSPFPVNSVNPPTAMVTDQAGAFLFTAIFPLTTSSPAIGAFTISATGGLTAVTGSPFAAVSGSTMGAIAVYPPATCANPVPLISPALEPDAVAAGTAAFTLTVNGTGFVSSSVVNWNGKPLTTTFVTRNQLTARVPAANVASAGTNSVTVTNRTPGGGTSKGVFFTVTSPTTALTLRKSDYAAGVQPWSVAVADFNGDGNLDLAIADNSGGTVAVLLGNGNGTFGTPTVYTVSGAAFVAIIAADFNGDGKLDLAVTDTGHDTVSVLLGNGNGTFQAPRSFSTGPGPQFLATADFNGDGKLDLAVTNYINSTGGNSVSVLLGNGDGTFQPQMTFATGVNPFSVAVGDFNADGILDLAVANGSGSISVLLGNGDGTFEAQSTVSLPGQPYTVVAADFNGDGKLDLAVTNADSAINTVSILLGNGDGTFQSPVPYGTGTLPEGLLVGDLNGDGKLDLAVTNQSDGTVSVLLGNGDGTFQAQQAFPTSADPVGLAMGDFNADGRLDLVTANIGSTNTVSVLLQVPAVTLNPTALSFANQLVGTTSSYQQVALTNTGSAPLIITSLGMSSPSDFAVSGGTCSAAQQVAPEADCTIQITFTPTQVGLRSAVLTVLDNASGTQTVSLSGTGIENLSITPTSLPGGTVGSPYSQTLHVTGGTAPYTWSISAGALPTGLSLSTAGVISGTPTTAATSQFTVKVADAVGGTATQPLSIVIAPLPTITTTSLPGGTVGTAYNQTLTASGGTTPYTWSITVGSIAPLTLNSTTGVISGTPTAAGTLSFTVQVKDANSNTATQALSIVVSPAGLKVTTTSLPGGTVGTAYNQTLTASGGTTPYTWSITVGSIAPLTLNSTTGVISGTPTVAGTLNFTVQVKDANSNTATQALSIVVTNPLRITTQPASQTIDSGKTATMTVVASGGTGTLTYQWYQGASGVTTNPISGATLASYTTPALTATTNYWVQVKDGGGSSVNSHTATITVAPPLSITTQPASQTISSGQTATMTVAATGGTGTLTYQWYQGSTGVTTNPIGGATLLSYTTPALTATTSYWVQVKDGGGSSVNSNTATVTVAPPLSITTQPASQTIDSGKTATMTVAATGGTGTLTYQWYQGTSGVTTNPISGATLASYTTPALTATTNYWVQVKDGGGSSVNSNTATITVNTPTAPSITTQPASQTINSGQTATMTVAAAGSAPLTYQWYQGASGATTNPISGATGTSYTTPALTATTSYWVQVKNSAGTANSNTAVITVNTISPPTCPEPSVQSGTNSLTVTATSNCTDSQSSITSTTIDWGDDSSPSSGTSASHPYTLASGATSGTFTITVTATNANNLSSSASATVTVSAPLTTPVPQGQAATQTVNVVAPQGMDGLTVTYACVSADGPNGTQPLSSYYLTGCTITGPDGSSKVTLSSTPQPLTVTVHTTAPTALSSARGERVGGLYAAFLFFPGIALLGMGFSRQRRSKLRRYACMALLGLMMLSWLACGGGTMQPPPVQNVTPTGAYGINGTGTSSTGTTVTITVGFTVTIG